MISYLKTGDFLQNRTTTKISKELGISENQVNEIRNGTLYPRKRINERIHKYYDSNNQPKEEVHNLTEIFESGITIGNKASKSRIFLSMIIVILISLLFTGFGYQPFWLFLLVLIIGIFVTLPSCFSQYWIINFKNIVNISYSKYGVIKLLQLMGLMKKYSTRIDYDSIQKVEIVYKKKSRFSPFDINPDYFNTNMYMKNGDILSINISYALSAQLTNFVVLLNQKGIDVYDKQSILIALQENKNLFDHFNKQYV